jgi:hypothetical protein
MERTAWTDERLEDFAHHVDARFDRVEGELRDLRQDVRTEIGSVRAEIGGLRSVLMTATVGIMAGLLGVIATLIAQG